MLSSASASSSASFRPERLSRGLDASNVLATLLDSDRYLSRAVSSSITCLGSIEMSSAGLDAASSLTGFAFIAGLALVAFELLRGTSCPFASTAMSSFCSTFIGCSILTGSAMVTLFASGSASRSFWAGGSAFWFAAIASLAATMRSPVSFRLASIDPRAKLPVTSGATAALIPWMICPSRPLNPPVIAA